MSISVCIVVFNTDPDLLSRCIESVNQSTGSHSVETIVIDNSNNDRLRDRFASSVSLWVASEQNDGFAVAVNRAVRLATGSWVLLLNPDAALPRDGLGLLVDAARTNGVDNLYGCWLTNAGGVQVDAFMNWIFSTSRLMRRSHYRKFLDSNQYRPVLDVEKVSGGSCWGSRRVFIELGPFDDRFFLYGEDADLSLRAKAAGMRLLAVPGVVVAHEGASSQDHHSVLIERARIDATIRLSSYHRRYAISLLLRIELLLVTLVGLLKPTPTSSGSRGARMARLTVLKSWGFKKDMQPWRP